jgi:hypothetical protein
MKKILPLAYTRLTGMITALVADQPLINFWLAKSNFSALLRC